MRSLKAGVSYFALVFGAGFALGSVRVPFLVPRLGVRVAELIETPFMLVAIGLSARYVIRHFELPPSNGIRLAVGFLALGLLVSAELLLALVLQGQSVRQYIAGRDPISGSAYLAMLGIFALFPFILARMEAAPLPSGRERA